MQLAIVLLDAVVLVVQSEEQVPVFQFCQIFIQALGEFPAILTPG